MFQRIKRVSPSHGPPVRWIPYKFRRTIVECLEQWPEHNKYEFQTTIPYVAGMKSNKQNGVETRKHNLHVKGKHLLGKTTTRESLLSMKVLHSNLFIHRYQALQMGASTWDCFPIQFTHPFFSLYRERFYTILMLRLQNKKLLQVPVWHYQCKEWDIAKFYK